MKKIILLLIILIFSILSGCSFNKKNITITTKTNELKTSFSQGTSPSESQGLIKQDSLGTIYSFQMMNVNQGWFIASKNNKLNLLRTTDGGKHITMSFKNIGASSKIHFFDINHGWLFEATGKKIIVMVTTDSGGHWIQRAVIDHSDYVIGIDFVTLKKGWIVTNSMEGSLGHVQRKVYVTNDGGLNWNKINDSGKIEQPSPSKNSLPQGGEFSSITFQTSKSGWIGFGGEPQKSVILYHTMDGGYTWEKVSIDLPEKLRSSNFYPETETPIFSKENPDKDFFLTQDGYNPKEARYVIYDTTNGGSTWKSLSLPKGINRYF